MSRLLLISDTHLGHKNICKYRTQFSSEEEHSETIYDNIRTNSNKRDTIYFLGDIVFTPEWLERIGQINCRHKALVAGNHDTERKVDMKMLANTFDKVYSLVSKNNCWFTHCPIHPQEIRKKAYVVHGHTHNKVVRGDRRYINVCVEHTDFKPISFERALSDEYWLHTQREDV